MSEINIRLAKIRKSRGLRQRDLAEMIGMKESTYSQMERQGGINCETLLKICNALKCSPLEILYGEQFKAETPKPEKATPYEPNPLLRAARALMESMPVSVNKAVIPIEEMGLVTPNEMRLLNFFREAKNVEKIEILNFAYNKIK